MEEQSNVRMPPGTTECNHSYYTGNSFSVPHFVPQLQNGTIATPVQPLASIQEVNDAAPSGFVSSSLSSCSALSSQVTAHPTRNVTGDVMPLAEAITQLPFLEFLQRCGVSIAPPQASQLPVPISLLDAAVQTTPPCGVSQDVSTQTSDQPVSSLSFDVAGQTSSHGVHKLSLDAAVQTISHSTPSQHVSTQVSSRSASSFSVDIFLQTPIRSVVRHDVAMQLPITEFFAGFILERSSGLSKLCSSVSVISTRTTCLAAATARTRTARPAFWSRCWFSLAHYTWRIYCSCNSTSSATFSYLSCASTASCLYHPVGSHHLRSATTGNRSASTVLAGTHNLANTDACAGSVPFPKPRALVLPLVHFGQSKPEGHTGLVTADSDLMHHQYRLSLLHWNLGPARKQPTNIVSAACGKFHAVILQEASDHVQHISDQFMAFTDNTDVAILLNKDTFEA